MKGLRSLTLWLALLAISVVVHGILSWRASLPVSALLQRPPAPEVPVDIQLADEPPPREELVF